MKPKLPLFVMVCWTVTLFGQQPYTASFVAKLGTDTVIVETYNMLPNHLYGKAFRRYPEDQIGVFDFHFYPDGSIKHYSMSYMNPDSGYITSSSGTEGVYCENDTCTWFASWGGDQQAEYVNKRQAKQMDFIGGWTPTLSLIEWNCMRLIKSGKQNMPVTMINDYIGIRQVAVSKGVGDTLIFGGDFLEYTKIKVSAEGRIIAYDGTATPWNYITTKLYPINVDDVAKRLSKTPRIGIPSPKAELSFTIGQEKIVLSYSRPFKRGRKIFGGVVPYDSIWRTGANDPTKISLPADIQFGQQIIPKGEYSLYTIPGIHQWTLIFNTNLTQWPTEPDRSKDFALIPLPVRNTKKTDQFTIDIVPEKDGGIIKFIWDETEAYGSFRIVKK
jgi:hypothetical protein